MIAFFIATALDRAEPSWTAAEAQLDDVRDAARSILGFDPQVLLTQAGASLPVQPGMTDVFVLPAALDFSLWQRETLGGVLTAARREFPGVNFHHDTVDPGHPLLVAAFAAEVSRAIAQAHTVPPHCGLLLAPSGHGDPASRADSYRLMRLLWEELGLRVAEVGFVRHAKPFLNHTLETCLAHPVRWLILPQSQWETEHVSYARVVLENYQRQHAEAANWIFVRPPAASPAITAWFVQRITSLWQQLRQRESGRTRSAKSQPAPDAQRSKVGAGLIACVPDRQAMAETLRAILPEKPERVLVKVTWHGYATGTYTDPAALDLLLGALPAPAVILEGHTSSRNLGEVNFDWETESRQNRAWIRQQESVYLRRTGLAEVLNRHKAQYLNVTEAFWDQQCACPSAVERVLSERGVELRHPEIAAFLPQSLLEFRGCPLISFAKMKGPTRLAISNLFGLIPDPLRTRWHGPNITWFAQVCCDIARLWGSFFELSAIVEGLFSAVRWNRQGLYRSRWGNYDLINHAGYLTAGRSLASADILASRLQGQDVRRSAFFDVVRDQLGWDEEAAGQPLPEETRALFA